MAETEIKKTGETKEETSAPKEKETEKTEKTADKPAEKPAEAKKDDKKEILDEIDDGDLILEDVRVSLPLTPENATFRRSGGGLISLTLINEKGETEEFERVILLRCFPMTNPDEFISVREADGKQNERGHELGMIRYMSEFDEDTQKMFLEEMDRRYFSPELLKINSIKEKFGYYYWDSVTSAGDLTFVLNNPFSNVRQLDDGRVFIYDIDGNNFVISDVTKLDPASYRRIETYL